MKTLSDKIDSNQREINQRFIDQEKLFGLHFDGLKARFDDLLKRLELERRIAAVEQQLDEKRVS